MGEPMKVTRVLGVPGVCVMIGSCTTVQLVKEVTAVSNSTKPCYDLLKDNPKYAELHAHLAVDTGAMPTDEQLADQGKMSSEMVQLAIEWYAENQTCNAQTIQAFSNYDMTLGAKVASWSTEITDIANDVLSTNPTYGYINAWMKHLTEHKRDDFREWAKAEIQRRQAAEGARMFNELGSNILTGARQYLQRRQGAAYLSQQTYSGSNSLYRAVRVAKTVCAITGQQVACENQPIGD